MCRLELEVVGFGALVLVVCPDPSRIPARRLRKATRRIEHEAGCLVWSATDGPR